MSALERAWDRWLIAAGPWRGWSVCPALLAPESGPPGVKRGPRPALKSQRWSSIVGALSAQLASGGVLVVLDLEPVLGVQIAAELYAMDLAHPVLVLPRWPYQQAILPAKELVSVLVAHGRRLPVHDNKTLPNVAFVLDADRAKAVKRRRVSDPRADNRYRLSVADMPNLATLQARAIRRVLKVSPAA